MSNEVRSVVIRQLHEGDFEGVMGLTRDVYPASAPWSIRQLSSHLDVFPEGQVVAVEVATQRIVGMAASLIVLWDDYDTNASWRDFTDGGMFTNHDPVCGRTLYGAEVMVHPSLQSRGVGSALYCARRALVERLGLLRIRAGAPDYLHHDPESLGFAAVIEWINRLIARPEDYPPAGYPLGRAPVHVGRRRRRTTR